MTPEKKEITKPNTISDSVFTNASETLDLEKRVKYNEIRQSIFGFNNKEKFEVLETAIDTIGFERILLNESKVSQFEEMIKRCSDSLSVIRYLFKKTTNLTLEITWSPPEIKNEYLNYIFLVKAVRYNSKSTDQPLYLNQNIIKARIYSRDLRIAKETLSWKIIELYYPSYLDQIINNFPIENFNRLTNTKKVKIKKKLKIFKSDPIYNINYLNQSYMPFPAYSNYPMNFNPSYYNNMNSFMYPKQFEYNYPNSNQSHMNFLLGKRDQPYNMSLSNSLKTSSLPSIQSKRFL